MEKKYLGKITHVSFGLGGYQDVQFGLSVTLEGQGMGTNTFIGGAWDYSFMKNPGEGARWTEEDRTKIMIDMIKKISELLKSAKVESVDQLKGKPVEMTIDNDNILKDWRILEEVL